MGRKRQAPLGEERAEEKRAGQVGFYRHLQHVYTSRAAACGRTADIYERKSA